MEMLGSMKFVSAFVATILLVVMSIGVFAMLYSFFTTTVQTPLTKVEKATREQISTSLPSFQVSEITREYIKVYNDGGKSLSNVRVLLVDEEGNYYSVPYAIDKLDPGYIGYINISSLTSNKTFVRYIVTTAEGLEKEIKWENKIPITIIEKGGVNRDYYLVEAEVIFPKGIDRNKVRVIDADGNEVPSFVRWIECEDLNKGLVAYYSFDDCTAKDLSGNKNDGTIYGAQCVEGKLGKALSFDGVDDYVEVPDSASLRISGYEITLEAWVYPTFSDTAQHIIINKEGHYEIALTNEDNTGAAVLGTNNFACAIQPHWAWVNSLTSIPANQWSHVVCTYDGRYTKLYVNGILKRTYDWGSIQAITTTTNALRIGARNAPGTPTSLWNGIIGEVRIYNRALSDEEIKKIYEGKCRTILSQPEKAIVYFEAKNISANSTKTYFIEIGKEPTVFEWPKVSISNPGTCEWWWCERIFEQAYRLENKNIYVEIGNVTEFQWGHFDWWRYGWQIRIDGSQKTVYTWNIYYNPNYWLDDLNTLPSSCLVEIHMWYPKSYDYLKDYINIQKVIIDGDEYAGGILNYWGSFTVDVTPSCKKLVNLKQPKIINFTIVVTPDSWSTNNIHVNLRIKGYNPAWRTIFGIKEKKYQRDDFRYGEQHDIYVYDDYGKEINGYDVSASWRWFPFLYSLQNVKVVSDKNIAILEAKGYAVNPLLLRYERDIINTKINSSQTKIYYFSIPNRDFDKNTTRAAINFYITGELGSRVTFKKFKIGNVDITNQLPELRIGDWGWGCDNCVRLYRYRFKVPSGVTISKAILFTATDEGVVCYLNGNQIALDNGCHWREYWRAYWNVNPTYFNIGGDNILACAVKEGSGDEGFDAEILVWGSGFPEQPYRLVPALNKQRVEDGILYDRWKYLHLDNCGGGCDPTNVACAYPTGWNQLIFDDSSWNVGPGKRSMWWPWWEPWAYWDWFYVASGIFNTTEANIPVEIEVSENSYMENFVTRLWVWSRRDYPAEITTRYILTPNSNFVKVEMELTNKGNRYANIHHFRSYITQWAHWDGRAVLDGYGESLHGWIWSASYIQIDGSKQTVYYINISDTFNTEEIPGGCGDGDWPRVEFRIRNMGTGPVNITDLYIGGKRWDQFPRENNFNLPIKLDPGAWLPWILIKSVLCRKSGDIPIIINVSSDSLSLGNGLFVRLWWWDGWWAWNLGNSEFSKPPETWVASWSMPWEDLNYCKMYCNQTFALIGVGKRSDYDWFHMRGDRAQEYWISKRFRDTNAVAPGQTVKMEYYEAMIPNSGWDAPRYGLPHPMEYARNLYLQLNSPIEIKVGRVYYYVE